MGNAIDILRDEHRIILDALALLERAADRLGTLSDSQWRPLLAWLRAFADHNHHAKEERALFPALTKAGIPGPGGPVDVMLEEHERGRALLREVETRRAAERTAAVHSYGALLREHIDKENGVLFPLAEAVLDQQALTALARDFEAIAVDLGAVATLKVAERTVRAFAAALVG